MCECNKWLSIESAPKDGTFLVWLEEKDKTLDSRVGVARYHPNAKVINGHFYFDMPLAVLWQPLPAPPVKEKP